MELRFDDWVFRIDGDRTNAYCKVILQNHCQCGYCRNFYQSVDLIYPQLRGFLAQFNASVDAPDELMPFEPTVLDAVYCVCGEIIAEGTKPLQINDLQITPVSARHLDFETECPMPCFGLCVRRFDLPWVLEEDMNEVVSPANEPEYLQRMWTKLLQEQEPDPLYS